MRNTLGFRGMKYPLKRNGSAITVKITLRRAAVRNLEVIMSGQGCREYMYEKGNKGNIVSMYEYKVTSEDAKRKRFVAERNRSLGSVLEGPSRKRQKHGISRSDLRDL